MKIKIFEFENEETCKYIVGATADIKAIYKSIARHSEQCDIYPFFCGSPKFSETKEVYAIRIDYEGNRGYGDMSIINSDTMLSLIINA